MALANAEKRIKSVEKYINESWEDFGMLYTKMLEGANAILDTLEIHKKGRQGKKMYTKKIGPEDWLTKSGYVVEITTKKDKQAEDIDNIQKLDAAAGAMPDNIPLLNIRKKKLLEFAELSAEEVNTVMEFEKQRMLMPVAPVPGEVNLDQPTEGQPVNASVSAQVPDVNQIGRGV
jgi:hypothetical protein